MVLSKDKEMFKRTRRYLVTGGCGFIGSALIRRLLRLPKVEVINVDKIAYTSSLKTLIELNKHPRHHHYKVDIRDAESLSNIITDHRPDIIIHLAAESQIDTSVKNPDPYIGTYNLLNSALELWSTSVPHLKFHHVSPKESFKILSFSRGSRNFSLPSNSTHYGGPDHLVRAWHQTYGLPVTISYSSNNYGPHQPQKNLIPSIVKQCLLGETILMDGEGENICDWLYVDDHVDALLAILESGKIGETYMIGGEMELKNIDLIHRICDYMDEHHPVAQSYHTLIQFNSDNLGHNYSTAIDTSKIRCELGWQPTTRFDEGLYHALRWHVHECQLTPHEIKIAR